MTRFFLLLLFFLIQIYGYSQENRKVKFGVAGLTHGHVNWILSRMEGPNYEVVGVAEKNDTLVQRLFSRYNIPEKVRFQQLEDMIRETSPDAILAFNSIFEHLEVVEQCAPMGIHVMVEKPMAVNKKHAIKMARLARENNILLLTNYETTWYGTTSRVMEEIQVKKSIGDIRKVVVRDGHPGPREIGVNNEFFVWLTDPVLNGGGALIDFGCYGANLITKIMKNQKPLSVTAVTQQIKPDIYPDVDDEATIILTYPRTQGIIQASWNWPMHRKDMDIYGTEGTVYQFNEYDMELIVDKSKTRIKTENNDFPLNDPFTYFSAVILKDIKVFPEDLSSLENNLIVVEILDAARRSAITGETIVIKDK